jgi:hypothetical protein
MSITTLSTVRGTICGGAPPSELTTFTGTPRSNRYSVAANASRTAAAAAGKFAVSTISSGLTPSTNLFASSIEAGAA